jgi:hypothetical protein
MDDHFRVTDADRDRAAALLRDHFVAGRLTAGELDERLTAALRGVTFGDLRRVLADLPAPRWRRRPTVFHRRPGWSAATGGCWPVYPAAHRRVHVSRRR